MDKKVKYLYLRSEENPNKVVTIGYVNDNDWKVVDFAVARCNGKDRFCRRVGRDIVNGRLRKHFDKPTVANDMKGGVMFVGTKEDFFAEVIGDYHPDEKKRREARRALFDSMYGVGNVKQDIPF